MSTANEVRAFLAERDADTVVMYKDLVKQFGDDASPVLSKAVSAGLVERSGRGAYKTTAKTKELLKLQTNRGKPAPYTKSVSRRGLTPSKLDAYRKRLALHLERATKVLAELSAETMLVQFNREQGLSGVSTKALARELSRRVGS